MTPLDSFAVRLSQAWPTDSWKQTDVLVAVSGGPDSLALLRGLLTLQPSRGKILAAHFNHGLRGAAAEADQQFVQRTCQSLNVDCLLGAADPGAYRTARVGAGLESAARQLRYQFLIETAERQGARYLATGHSADDQAETVLHHVLRGTGLAGLAGIPAIRRASEAVTLVRPLLSVSRAEILEYLKRLDQPFRVDSTNLDPCFTRNRLRQELLPWIEQQLNPRVRQALLRLAQIAAEAQQSLAACLTPLLDQYVHDRKTPQGTLVEIDCDAALGRLTPHLQRELFVAVWRKQRWPMRRMGFHHWQQLTALLVDTPLAPQLSLPSGIQASRRGRQILLARQPGGAPSG